MRRFRVRILSKPRIIEASEDHPDWASLNAWYNITIGADWNNFSEVRATLRSADSVGSCVVFNIANNRCRLVAWINYKNRKVFIRNILTHKDYDRGSGKMIATELQKNLSTEIGMPDPITSDKQNELYTRCLFKLEKSGSLSKIEEKVAEVLTVLIEAYESRHHEIPDASPLEVLEALIDANRLKQKDLAPIFGSESIVSEVLNGRRELNLKHIKGLSKKFHVSPAVFIAT